MNKIAAKVARRIRKEKTRKVVELAAVRQGNKVAAEALASAKTPEALVDNGYDPVHAAYVSAQNLLSLVFEGLLEYKELDRFGDILAEADDLYFPSGPPMSPVTKSFFFTWSGLDLRLGIHKESLASIAIQLQHLLGIPAPLVQLWQNLSASRMGMYQHMGFDGEKVVLRELYGEQDVSVYVASGYRGKAGELWHVRLLPVAAELPSQKVAFTTPHVLTAGLAEWQGFFERASWKKLSKEMDYHELMRYGATRYYWLEFIHQAYLGMDPGGGAIYLAGVPDKGQSRPHFSQGYQAHLPEFSTLDK